MRFTSLLPGTKNPVTIGFLVAQSRTITQSVFFSLSCCTTTSVFSNKSPSFLLNFNIFLWNISSHSALYWYVPVLLEGSAASFWSFSSSALSPSSPSSSPACLVPDPDAYFLIGGTPAEKLNTLALFEKKGFVDPCPGFEKMLFLLNMPSFFSLFVKIPIPFPNFGAASVEKENMGVGKFRKGLADFYLLVSLSFSFSFYCSLA